MALVGVFFGKGRKSHCFVFGKTRFSGFCVGVVCLLWSSNVMASSQLSERSFFPTHNFELAWPTYLPAHATPNAAGIYQTANNLMQPGYFVKAEIQAEVRQDDQGLHYVYTVTNASDSIQPVSLFGIERRAPVYGQKSETLFVPMSLDNPYGYVVWHVPNTSPTRVRTLSVSVASQSATIPVAEHGLFPKETVTGLGVSSRYLPGIVSAFVRADGWLIDLPTGGFVSAPIHEKVSGKTIGPVLMARGLDAQGFSVYFRGLVEDAIALGWVKGDVAVQSRKFMTALQDPSQDPGTLYKAFHGYLTGFWFGTADMSSEGKALLVLNAAYAMQQFSK